MQRNNLEKSVLQISDTLSNIDAAAAAFERCANFPRILANLGLCRISCLAHNQIARRFVCGDKCFSDKALEAGRLIDLYINLDYISLPRAAVNIAS